MSSPRARNNRPISHGEVSFQSVPTDSNSFLPEQVAQSPTATFSTSPAVPITTTSLTPSSPTSRPVAGSPVVLTALVPLRPLPPSVYTNDTLTLTENTVLSNRTYTPINKAGISSYRPELLSVIRFQPVLQNDRISFTNFGKLFDVCYQARILRKDTLDKMLNNISKNVELSVLLQNQIQIYNDKINILRTNIQETNSNVSATKMLENALEIKQIPDSHFGSNSTIKHFFTAKMQYPAQTFELFSETKILGQMLFDLRSALNGYSLSLLNSTDQDRIKDTSPVSYDTSYSTNPNFNFRIENIRSVSTPRNARSQTEFNAFCNSLPGNLEDRIKLLVHILSKELRVSKGLSKSTVRNKLQSFFQANQDGDPFDNLVGFVGNSIFDAPVGINSLSSLLYTKTGDLFVLPFENKYIDDKTTTFIPGKDYFIDSIFNSGTLSTDAVTNYASNFASIVNEVKNAFQELFDFNVKSNKLLPENIFNSFLKTIIRGNEQNQENLISLAIMKLATTNKTIHLELFSFLCLAGMATVPLGEQKNIFAKAFKDDPTVSQNDFMASYYDTLVTKATNLETLIRRITSNTKLETKTTDRNHPFFNLQENAIKNCLMSCVVSANADTNIFKEFIATCNTLDRSASIEGNELAYTLFDNTGRTRYNFISSSHILLISFEILLAIVSKFTDVELEQNNGRLLLIYSREFNETAKEAILNSATDQITEERNPLLVGVPVSNTPKTNQNSSNISSNVLAVSIQTIANKLKNEDVFIEDVIGIFGVISNQLTQNARRAATYFAGKTNKLGIVNVGQARTASWLFDLYNENNQQKTAAEKNAILSLFSEPEFLGKPNIKCLSVGIPNGFIDFLSGRLNKNSLNSTSFKNNNSDLIQIKVYYKSIEFEDVIFLPQNYIFDLALFYKTPTLSDLNINTRFDSILSNQSLILDDYTSGIKTPINLAGILGGEKYVSLQATKRKELFKNHFTSGLLNEFFKTISGLNSCEDTFTIQDHPKPNPSNLVKNLARDYFTKIKGITLPEGKDVVAILEDISIPQNIKEELSLLLYGNIGMQEEQVEFKVTSPKLFERVFLIPVNMNKFVVDVKTTQQTYSGKQILSDPRFKQASVVDLRTGNITLKKSELSLDDVFVTIETVD